MTGDRATFLRAIVAAPGDDLPRLVYADWLDERGDPRAEFVRVQVAVERTPPTAELSRVISDGQWELLRGREGVRAELAAPGQRTLYYTGPNPVYADLRARERELVREHRRTWLRGDCPLKGFDPYESADDPAACGWSGHRGSAIGVRYRRGFIDAVTCTAFDWRRNHAAILAGAPVAQVRLDDGPFGFRFVAPAKVGGPWRCVLAARTTDGDRDVRGRAWPSRADMVAGLSEWVMTLDELDRSVTWAFARRLNAAR
jgi:uncharacterized protein (TIGR02996 family)